MYVKHNNIMKYIKSILVVLACGLALVGCSKSSNGGGDDGDISYGGSVIGTWHMVSWSNVETGADIYLAIEEDGSFTLYQRYTEPFYQKFEGTYSYNDSVLSGSYDDGVAWADSYNVSFNADNTKMTMVRASDQNDISVYEKSTIPDEILSGMIVRSSIDFDGDSVRFL